MKKKYKIEVDCANCAAKIEDAIRRLEGVDGVNIKQDKPPTRNDIMEAWEAMD